MAAAPQYRIVADALLARIRAREWPVGAALPPEVTLARDYAVGRSTVREAMRSLESLGLVDRRRGAGTFVRPIAEPGPGRRFVGLVVAHLDDLRLAETLAGLEEGLRARDFSLAVRATHDVAAAEAHAVESLRGQGAAGILLEPAPGWPSRDYLRRCLADGLPVVLLDRYDPELPAAYAVADNLQGALALTRHLLAAGHRRIAFMFPRAFATTTMADRWQGYVQALAEAGVEPDPRMRVRLDGGLPDPLDGALRAAVDRLMALPLDVRPTAIMCPNDEVASWVLSLLKQCGVRVPQECSLTGFDDLPYAARMDPPLTTVQQPLRSIGRAAADRLLAWLRVPDVTPAPAVLPARLVVRASTTRAPAAARPPVAKA